MKPETKFRINRVDPKLRLLQNTWFESIQQKAIRDTPDKIGCVNGCFVALEIKASEKATTRLGQVLKGEMIKKAGGYWFKVYPENWDEIFNFLKGLANGKSIKHGKKRNCNCDE